MSDHLPFTIEYMMEGENEYKRQRMEAFKTDPQHKPSTSTSNNESSAVSSGTLSTLESVSLQIEEDDDMEEIAAIAQDNDISVKTIDEEKQIGFFKILRMAMKRRLTAFAQEGSIAYLTHLVESSPTLVGRVARKILWILLLLFGIVVLIYQFYDCISYFLSYPTIATFEMAYNASLRFPSVTLCPESRLGRKFVSKKFGSSLVDVRTMGILSFPGIELHADNKSFNSSSWNLNWTEMYILASPQMEDTIFECQFRQMPCNMNKDIKQSITDHRHCFTINPESSNFVTTQTGATNGLRLILYTNQSDTMLTSSPASGFRVFLHDPGEIPTMNADGFRVSVGTSTAAGFTFKNVSQLPSPYGDCRNEKGYTFMKCMASCQSDYLWRTCHCVGDILVTKPMCPPEQMVSCFKPALDSFVSSGESRKCDCPLHCQMKTYPYSVSFSPLSKMFLNYTSKRLNFRGRNISMSRLKREIAFVDIFYSRLIYENYQTKPAYDPLKLFADLGGALGLILGGTVLTVYEVGELIVELFFEMYESIRFLRMLRTAQYP